MLLTKKKIDTRGLNTEFYLMFLTNFISFLDIQILFRSGQI